MSAARDVLAGGDPGDDLDPEFVELLGVYDEAFAAGLGTLLGPGAPGDRAAGVGDRPQAREAWDCLRMLESVWPRGGGVPADPAPEGPAAGATPARGEGQSIGRFRVVRRIGSGGGGVVFLAFDPLLGRRLALKVPRPEAMLSPGLRKRFLREARAAAGLDHPNLVPVFEAGEVGPVCYIASAYCEGETLAQWLRARETLCSPQDAALLVSRLTAAVDHAHRRGILHRDIKPSNVLMTPADGRLGGVGVAVGRLVPRLTDFGLARLDDEAEPTRHGQIFGTPRYMAPEQAEGRTELYGPPTDVYALGALLYEVLVGRPPFQGDSQFDVLRGVVDDDPVPPRVLRPTCPRDLEAICLTCLEKDPSRRYATAGALAEDLGRFLDGRATVARPLSRVGRGVRWARRNRALAAMTAAAAALLTAVVLGTSAAAVGFSRQAATERGLRGAEAEARRALEGKLYYHHIAQAQHEWQADDPAGVERHLAACPPALRGWEWHYLRGLGRGKTTVLRMDAGNVNRVAYSPDGTLIASAAGRGKGVWLWDAATGRVRQKLRGPDHEVWALAFHPDGRRIASGGDQAAVVIHDLATGEPVMTLRGHAGRVVCLAFSPDGRRLASGSHDETVRIWDPADGREVATFRDHDAEITDVAFDPEGHSVASADTDGDVKIWGAADGRKAVTLRGPSGRVHAVAYTPDGRRLMTAGEGQDLLFWDLASERVVETLHGHGGLVTSLALSGDGGRIASGSEDGEARVWDAVNGRAILTLTGHTDAIRDVAFSPDGRSLVTAGWDETVRLWDVTRGRDSLLFNGGHTKAVLTLAVSPDGRHVASAGRDRLILIWDASTGRVVQTLHGHTESVHDLAFGPDGRRLISGGGDQTLRVWDLETGRMLRSLEGVTSSVHCVAFSPDGRWIAAGVFDHSIQVWHTAGSQPRTTLLGHEGPLQGLAFSPDGGRLASVGDDGVTKVWDPATGRVLLNLGGHVGKVSKVAFSPDGRSLATAGFDRTIRVWDLRTGRQLFELTGHTGFITGVAFSPDGRRIASSGWDGDVRVWDALTGEHAVTLGGRGGRIRGVAFSPDGHRIYTGSSDSTVQVWDATPSERGREIALPSRPPAPPS